MTYEELYTVIVQVEACLNSRPLTPLSNDPYDYAPLTPGHFLIGDSLMALPQHDVTNIHENRLDRYQRTQHCLQQFWQRWSKEYLSNLQVRTKWRFEKAGNVNVGELVLIKEDKTPPQKWSMSRIIELHPGPDNLVRVVSLKLPNGAIVKRAINKICLFPKSEEDNNSE